MNNKINESVIYKNFKRNNKWLGIIDYKSLTFLAIYGFVIWNILNLFSLKLEYIIYIFILLVVPVISIFFVNINNQSAYDVILIMLKYYNQRCMFIRKDYEIGYKSEIYLKSHHRINFLKRIVKSRDR